MTEKHIKKRRFAREQVIKFVLVFVLIWFAISFVLSNIIGMMIKTAVIGKETVENVCTPYGLVTCDAYLVDSPLNGQGSAITQEGERVRKNEAVYRVTAPAGSAMQSATEKIMYAPLAGIVSYRVDGYEYIKSMEDVQALDLADIHKTQAGREWETKATSGEAFAKILNNFDDIFIYMDCDQNSYTETFEADMRVRIRFPELGYSTLCRIVEVEPWQNDGIGRYWIKADLGTAEQAVLNQRVWQVELPYDVTQVIEIPKEAIVYMDGEPGVYTLDKGFAYWSAVTITEERSDTYVVEDLKEGTEIVTTPKLVGEGERVKAK